MTKHTPEPWKFSDDDPEYGVDVPLVPNCREDAFDYDPEGEKESTENYKRILYCVNACAGLINPGEDIKRLDDYRLAALALFGSLKTSRTILGGSLGLIMLSAIVDLIFSGFSNLQPLLLHLPAFILFLAGFSWLWFLYRYAEKEYKRIKKVYLGEER